MSAATAAREGLKKPGEVVAYKMGAVKIYKNTMVSVRVADGMAYPSRSGTATDIFVGVARETVDNSAGAAGDKTLVVEKRGTYEFAKASAVQTDVGLPFYASDDSTLTATSTNNQLVGYGVAVETSAILRIRINAAVK